MKLINRKKYDKKTTVLILFLIICFNLVGQEPNKKKQVENGVYILPTQIIFPEIILTFEQFVKQDLSFSYSLGYKIPTGKGNTLETFGHGFLSEYELQYIFNEFSNAVYGSIAPSFYLNNERRYYLQPELFYRLYWFDNKKLIFDNVESYRYNSIRSELIHVIGLKFLAGINSMINLSDKKAIVIKTYAGIGIRYKNYKYENIDNVVKDFNNNITIIPYELEKGDLFTPSIHLGINIGISKTNTKNK